MLPLKCLLAGLLVIVAACQAQPKADLIIYGGTIHTGNPDNPRVDMVVVKDGKIAFAGPKAELENWQAPNTRLLNLAGKTMTSGLIESHGHFLSMGYARMQVDLNDTRNYEEMIERVVEAAQTIPPGEWILGRGWHQSKWSPQPEKMVGGFQTHDKLSAAVPDHPVFLRHASGHAAIANARAMEIAGVTRQSQFGAGGEIIKDGAGNPTGIFNEEAMTVIRDHIPKRTATSNRRALELASDYALENGITSFHDAGEQQDGLDLFREAAASGDLGPRLYVMLDGSQPALLQHWFESGPLLDFADNYLTVRAIKLYADGALGSRGAWLLEPYSDMPGHTGLALQPMDSVLAICERALDHGFQVCTHAIGDRANREVLNQYQSAMAEKSAKGADVRFRVEHAQHLSAEDIPRFAQLGIIPSMQGIHMSSDRPWAIDRLGIKRIEEGAYVWQKLLQSGARVINGTDVPVEPINPVACFYALVTRKTLAGTPEGGYEPAQKMTREQALRSYTRDAAYGAFQEDQKGTIEPGKLADFTVFSQDLLTIPEESLLDTRIEYTIIGGKIKYERGK